MSALLPPGFSELESFAVDWVGADAADRAAIRDRASPEDAQAFYDAVHPIMGAALVALDNAPLAQHDEAKQRLMRLLLTFAHVALAVEMQREEEKNHAKLRAHLAITRTPADNPASSPAVAVQ